MTAANTATRFDDFTALLPGRRVVPVVRELFADGETPVGIYRKLAGDRPGTFLLESAEQGGIWSRYSFVGAASYGVLTERDGTVDWIDTGLSRERALGEASDGLAPLAALEALYERWATEDVPGAPPLTGGLVGFIGWEAIRQIEHLPNRPPADFSVPGQAFAFVSELVVIDHRTGTVQLVASVLNDLGEAPETLRRARLDQRTRPYRDPRAGRDRAQRACTSDRQSSLSCFRRSRRR